MQKFSSEELADMPTCNLLETMHNVWLQQSRKRGTCLYIATSNEYVWAFKQSTLYSHFKQGGQLGQGHNKSELFLHRTTQSGDLKELVDVVLKYFLISDYTIKTANLEGVEIFGSYKWKANLTPISKGDSHRHDYVNFFHPCVNHTIASSSVNIEEFVVDQVEDNVEALEAPLEMEFGI